MNALGFIQARDCHEHYLTLPMGELPVDSSPSRCACSELARYWGPQDIAFMPLFSIPPY